MTHLIIVVRSQQQLSGLARCAGDTVTAARMDETPGRDRAVKDCFSLWPNQRLRRVVSASRFRVHSMG